MEGVGPSTARPSKSDSAKATAAAEQLQPLAPGRDQNDARNFFLEIRPPLAGVWRNIIGSSMNNFHPRCATDFHLKNWRHQWQSAMRCGKHPSKFWGCSSTHVVVVRETRKPLLMTRAAKRHAGRPVEEDARRCTKTSFWPKLNALG